jgi:hypothetical protein
LNALESQGDPLNNTIGSAKVTLKTSIRPIHPNDDSRQHANTSPRSTAS